MDDLAGWFNHTTKNDVRIDEAKHPDDTRQCTMADAQRIMGDLLIKGIIKREQFERISETMDMEKRHVPSTLHNNQTVRFVHYLVRQGQLPEGILEMLVQADIRETRPEDLDELKRFFD